MLAHLLLASVSQGPRKNVLQQGLADFPAGIKRRKALILGGVQGWKGHLLRGRAKHALVATRILNKLPSETKNLSRVAKVRSRASPKVSISNKPKRSSEIKQKSKK